MSKWAEDFIEKYGDTSNLKKRTKSRKENERISKELKLASKNITEVLTGCKKRRSRKWGK